MVFLVPDGRHMLLSAISDGGMRRISILAHGVLMRFRRLVLGAFSKAKNRVNRIKSRSIDYKIEERKGKNPLDECVRCAFRPDEKHRIVQIRCGRAVLGHL